MDDNCRGRMPHPSLRNEVPPKNTWDLLPTTKDSGVGSSRGGVNTWKTGRTAGHGKKTEQELVWSHLSTQLNCEYHLTGNRRGRKKEGKTEDSLAGHHQGLDWAERWHILPYEERLKALKLP